MPSHDHCQTLDVRLGAKPVEHRSQDCRPLGAVERTRSRGMTRVRVCARLAAAVFV